MYLYLSAVKLSKPVAVINFRKCLREYLQCLSFKWEKIKRAFLWLTPSISTLPPGEQWPEQRIWTFKCELLVYLGKSYQTLFIFCRYLKNHTEYLMTWKNVLSIVSNEKASSVPGCLVWSPLATLSGWVSDEKTIWKDVFQQAHGAYSSFDAIMGAFYFSILLICTVWIFSWQTCVAFAIRKECNVVFYFLKNESKSKQQQNPAAFVLRMVERVEPFHLREV